MLYTRGLGQYKKGPLEVEYIYPTDLTYVSQSKENQTNCLIIFKALL
ncbi:hypothetical protein VBD025_11795 [Virgibacillus flavescens]